MRSLDVLPKYPFPEVSVYQVLAVLSALEDLRATRATIPPRLRRLGIAHIRPPGELTLLESVLASVSLREVDLRFDHPSEGYRPVRLRCASACADAWLARGGRRRRRWDMQCSLLPRVICKGPIVPNAHGCTSDVAPGCRVERRTEGEQRVETEGG